MTVTGIAAGDATRVSAEQPEAAGGAVVWLGTGNGDDAATFGLDLAVLPPDIDRVAFWLEGRDADEGAPGPTEPSFATIRIADAANGRELCRFALPLAGSAPTTIVLGEVYRQVGEWRFRTLGHGLAGHDLARHGASGPGQAGWTPTVAPESGRDSTATAAELAPVALERQGQSVSLGRRPAGFGNIRVTLAWARGDGQEQRSGLLGGLLGSRDAGAIDLDIGCLFELQNGERGAVQALGNALGTYDAPPYIQVSGDHRSDTLAACETLRINGNYWSELRRILIYAFIYEGAPNWVAADAVVAVRVPGEPPLEIRLDNAREDRGLCAVVLLENGDGDMKVTRLSEYFRSHSDLDSTYDWGLRWAAGSK